MDIARRGMKLEGSTTRGEIVIRDAWMAARADFL